MKPEPSKKSKLVEMHALTVSAIARKAVTIRRLEREIDAAMEALSNLQAQIEAEDATIN